MRHRLLCLLLPLAALIGAQSVQAAPATATGVDQKAVTILDRVESPLLVGSELFIGQKIITGEAGQVQVLFADNTHLVIGPNSSLVIEDYLMRADGSVGKLAIDALGGTFRFITGNSPKDRYAITTPNGTLGIRGTEFDLTVDRNPGGRTNVLVYSGIVKLCATSGECSEIANECALGEMSDSSSTAIGYTGDYDRKARQAFKEDFVYTQTQTGLSNGYKIRNANFCLRTSRLFEFLLRPLPTSDFDPADPGADVDPQNPGGVTDPEGPAGSDPTVPTEPDPLPPDEGGDCAGNSTPNPGNSQNCK